MGIAITDVKKRRYKAANSGMQNPAAEAMKQYAIALQLAEHTGLSINLFPAA